MMAIKRVAVNNKTRLLIETVVGHNVPGVTRWWVYYGTRTSQMNGEYIPAGARYWMICKTRVGSSWRRDEIIALDRTITGSLAMLDS